MKTTYKFEIKIDGGKSLIFENLRSLNQWMRKQGGTHIVRKFWVSLATNRIGCHSYGAFAYGKNKNYNDDWPPERFTTTDEGLLRCVRFCLLQAPIKGSFQITLHPTFHAPEIGIERAETPLTIGEAEKEWGRAAQ